MQLLGILVITTTAVSNIRLVKMARLYTWILASVSILCAVLAIPLYLYVPAKWAALLSFLASVVQALLILQLVYAL